MTIKKVAGSSDTAQVILDKSLPLFARSGYAGVSMRNIATAVGISGAALYHHYPDKQSLYVATMGHAFADKASSIQSAIDNKGTPEQRLERFVTNFTKQMASDPDFRALLQRELLDGDEMRLKVLAENVFIEPFKAIKQLAQEMSLNCDAHLLAISMAGLILFHFETESIRRYLPGGLKKHNDPKVIAQHVISLLMGDIRK
jgi:AcrR family transcriptional regulator